MKDYYPKLFSGNFYHIYNRGNNKENIFYQHRNYTYFLTKYDAYLTDCLETYAYCLLPNHFHLLVRVKDNIVGDHGVSEIVSEQFRRFFIGYSQAINKQENRTGSLFQKNYRRLHVVSARYLIRLIYYIHINPQNHGLIKDFREYSYSSYLRIIQERSTRLFKKEVLEWFGSKETYIEYHQDLSNLGKNNPYIIED